jgi:hypothetical protein
MPALLGKPVLSFSTAFGSLAIAFGSLAIASGSGSGPGTVKQSVSSLFSGQLCCF